MANLRKGVLNKVSNFLEKQNYEYEVIIVDDGSRDGSIEFIEDFVKENRSYKLIKISHKGKGGAVTAGMLRALGKYILFTDMDQATPIEELNKLLPYFEESYDIVIGSRNTQRKGSPLLRQIISRLAIILRKFLIGLGSISDTQCGFKMFKKEVAEKLFSQVNTLHNGFKEIKGSAVAAGFDIELLYLAQKKGYTIKEVPVNWLYVESRRVNPITDSVEGFFDLIKIRLNIYKGIYE